MKLKYARMNVRATCGDSYILAEITPSYVYVDGKRVGEPVGYTYTVILPARKYESLRVRIDGPLLIEDLDEPIEVKIENLSLDIRWSQSEGNYIAGTATGIAPVANT